MTETRVPFQADAAPRIDIGIIIPRLEKYGGAERFVIECVRHWQHRHAVTIYAMTFDRDLLTEHGIGDGVRMVELPGNLETEHAFVLNAVLLPKLWRQKIGRHDVYHTHLWPTHLVDLHPMVWFPHEPLRALHDLRFEQRISEADQEARDVHVYPKFSYDRVDAELYDAYLATIEGMDHSVVPAFTVANSRYTAGYLAGIYRREMPHVVYPGVDIERPIDLAIDRKLFVTIAQLWPHKRIDLLIEAVALTDQIQLAVIGSGPELDRLSALSARLGVEDRVFFLTGLSNYEVRLVLARACAFVFCPIKEPFGIVVLEAMAAGKPVIAADEGGYREVCSPDYALLLPPSPLKFAEAMQQLRDDPDRVASMGQAARLAAVPYTWERTARELEGFLLQAARPAPATAAAGLDRSRPLVGIQYYLWYGDGFGAAHWNDDPRSGHVADHPFLGFYASEKGRTIEHHLAEFERMQLDFVILNLHIDRNGPNSTELAAIRNLFDIAKAKGSPLKFAIQLSPYDDDTARLRRVIDTIRSRFAAREAYFRLDGSPVLFWFWSSAQDGSRAFLDTVGDASAHFTNLAFSLRAARGPDEAKLTLGRFQGFALYSPLEAASERNWSKVWQGAYEASERAGMRYRMITVSPGYDDRALLDPRREGNPHRLVARSDGRTYARSLAFAAALDPRPDLVVVSTYNEYHENTHIEPTSLNGDRYVRMTREFVEALRAAHPDGGGPDDE